MSPRRFAAAALAALLFASAIFLVFADVFPHRSPVIFVFEPASVPAGIYLRVPRDPNRGDAVMARPSSGNLAVIKRNIPDYSGLLLKLVAGIPGERLCRGDFPASRSPEQIIFFDADGCTVLSGYFLIGSNPRSFDSRHFGQLPEDHILATFIHL